MIEPVTGTYQFHLKHSQFYRSGIVAVLWLVSYLVCAIGAITISITLWHTYSHVFTPYLKWQDAIVALLSFIAFISLGGCAFVIRFLVALYAGYRRGMIILIGGSRLSVRDLSTENLFSVFWMVNSAFWCFVAILVGLLPEVLIGWTLHLSNPLLAFFGTSFAVLLSVAGLGLSVVAAVFLVLGCVGVVSLFKKLGSPHHYQLTSQAVLRIDDFVLTIIYPASPESMVELKLLEPDDQRLLLSMLRERWIDAQQAWNPTLGDEIAEALQEAERSAVLV